MENRILARLDGRADPEWLLTLLSVLPLNTYTLEGGTRHCPKRQGGGSSARLTGRYPTIYTGWF